MAGAGYKLFNTGDVLTAAQVNTYLMEQTVMVFADAAARTAALSGVVSEGMISYLKDTNAVEVYNGSAWVASDDPNAIQNTIVDAKGDLITATAADTPARLAVGNNGETIVADSSASTGLRWQGNFAAGKNKIINGDFNIWQRGTSFTTPALNAYTADRFYQAQNGTAPTITHSQQSFTAGTAPVSGYESTYFYRVDQTVAGSAATFNFIGQRIEDVRTFAGQTMTFSFWAKAASTITLPSVEISQVFGSGGSTSVNTTLASSVSVGTTWTRYSYTVSVPSISGKTLGAGSNLIVRIFLPLNSTFTFDTWGWQSEAGSVATAFQTATGTLAGELANCQRYYQRIRGDEGNGGTTNPIGLGSYYNASIYRVPVRFPVKMRRTPDYSSSNTTNYFQIVGNGATVGYATTTLDIASPDAAMINVAVSGATTGTSAWLQTANASSFIDFSAEL